MFKLSIAFSVATLAAAADLTAYCQLLADQCLDVHGLNAVNCGQAMINVAIGTDADVDQNTIGCRQKFLAAGSTVSDKCRFAGPSGGGRCGPVLDTVCQVATTVCGGVTAVTPSFATEAECKTGLAGVQAWGSKQGSLAASENSLECRVYHALASYGGGPSHCGHFGPIGSTTAQCTAAVSVNASHYCDIVTDACSGSNTQYGTKAQCLAVAAGFTPGATGSTPGDNTLGCRTYHAQVAKSLPATHCEHAGPSGGGVCGPVSEAWGSILAAAPCSDPHVNMFLDYADSNATYIDSLVPSGMSSTSKYSTTLDTSGNTQACRIYHLGVAGADNTHCSHGYLSGGANCGNYIDNLCTLVQGACGFGANATWQFANLADCKTQMAGLQPGMTKPQDVANNTYECRFYHAGVAASYAPYGKNAGATGAGASRILHCSHVLKPAAAGGCGYVAPAPTPGVVAPTPKATTPSSASGLSVLASLLVVGASALSL